MKKTVKKLKLHRETMHLLAQDGLRIAVGGSAATVCRTCPGDPTCAPCGPTHTRACC
jgi:hypothetical protein